AEIAAALAVAEGLIARRLVHQLPGQGMAVLTAAILLARLTCRLAMRTLATGLVPGSRMVRAMLLALALGLRLHRPLARLRRGVGLVEMRRRDRQARADDSF